jgi:hypothetical protein
VGDPDHERILREGRSAVLEWMSAHPDEHLNLAEVSIRNAVLSGFDLQEAELSRAVLPKARLLRANLLHARLVHAKLRTLICGMPTWEALT